MRKALLTTGTAVTAAVVLAGCSAGGFDSVQLTNEPGTGDVPEVEFETPVKVEENQAKVLQDGDGEDVEAGDGLMIQVSLYRGSDMEQMGESYTQGAGQALVLDDTLEERLPELYEALEGMKVGGVVAYSAPSTSGAAGQEGQEGQESPGGDDSTAVEVYHIVDEFPGEIEGEMQDSPEGMPEVTENDEGVPQIGEIEGDAPEGVASDYLIEGDGEEVQEGDAVVVDYVGVRREDGEVFDSTWETGTPAAVPLDSTIPGWSEALVGKKAGSRVIMSIPAEQAFGTEEELGAESGYPTGDLVVVMDLLDRAEMPEPEPLPEPSASEVNQGDGEEVDEGDTLLVKTAPVADGEPQGEQLQVMRLDDELKGEDQFTYDQLAGSRVGTSLDLTQTVDMGDGQPQEMTTRFTVEEIVPEGPEGEMQPSPSGLPAVTEGEDGTPQIATPQGEAPDEVVTETLIEGDGEEVQSGDSVVVDYTGVRWADGEVFDSSYERGAPTVFPLDQVIEGWSEGLEGQRVGSRVLISVPADKAYGTEEEIAEQGGQEGTPAGDLLFAVDILSSAETPAQPEPEMPQAPAPEGPAAPAPAPAPDSAEG